MQLISKVRAAAESAARTFIQAAVASLTVTLAADLTGQPVSDARWWLAAVVVPAVAAGLAAVGRVLLPLSTDLAGRAVDGAGPRG